MVLVGTWRRGAVALFMVTSVQQPEPMERKPGQGFRAGGHKPQLGEGKIALGGFRNTKEEIEFPIGWWFK